MSEIETNEENVGYQINVVNIKYGKQLTNSKNEKPDMVTLDVPEALLKIKNKGDEQKFLDYVETFAYNTVSRKYGAEVNSCQVWLPLENEA